jgi:hypothetical protein
MCWDERYSGYTGYIFKFTITEQFTTDRARVLVKLGSYFLTSDPVERGKSLFNLAKGVMTLQIFINNFRWRRSLKIITFNAKILTNNLVIILKGSPLFQNCFGPTTSYSFVLLGRVGGEKGVFATCSMAHTVLSIQNLNVQARCDYITLEIQILILSWLSEADSHQICKTHIPKTCPCFVHIFFQILACIIIHFLW